MNSNQSTSYNQLLRKAYETIEVEFALKKRPTQPFRSRYRHTQRVLKWAERIHEIEGGDYHVIELAALFHDVGWEDGIPHQVVSRRFAAAFFEKEDSNGELSDRVCNAVLLHNQRHIANNELTLEERIVMDADALDEVGIVSIVWDALALSAIDEHAGYEAVYSRIHENHEKLRSPEMQMKTETGTRLFRERFSVFENAMEELAYELGLQ